jgi:beta-glucosidase
MEKLAFVHFGLNTFDNKEWGYGNASPEIFNPVKLDCDQWVRTFAEAGIKEVILTAKHHDGFCLWPTRLTEYCIRQSPYKDGKGDVVGELATACRKYGMKFGIYLSPWDRHQATYGSSEYIAYYYATLKELLTGYGDISEVWLDGANGGDGWYGGAKEIRKIDRKTYYRLERAYRMIDELQPEAVIFSDGGPGCRWIGNEEGFAGTTNWSFLRSKEVYPGYDKPKELTTGHVDGDRWIPGECDVSIRPGWFWHEAEDTLVKTVQQLVDLYYYSVGRNANLLLNFPVNRDGLISPVDSANAVAAHRQIQAELSGNLLADARIEASDVRGKPFEAANVTNNDYDAYWATSDGVNSATITFTLPRDEKVNRFLLQEYIPLGQRVKAFVVEYLKDGLWQTVDAGEETTTVGYKRILRFPTVTTRRLRVRFTDARACLCISNIAAYYTDGSQACKNMLPYRNPDLPVEVRTQDLLARMTPEEKVGQLLCPLGWEMYTLCGREVSVSSHFKAMLKEKNMGMLWGVYRADPWTGKTLENGLNPELAAETGNALQKYTIENTRLGIPLFLAEEAPHGHMAIGATVFPTGIGMASTWNTSLLEKEGAVIAREIRLQGGHISYGPVLDLARDPRWSRMEETFGEDPVLSAELGAAMVRGLGGGNLGRQDATLATLKHFIAYGIPQGGHNGGPALVGSRELASEFLPPFHKAIRAGALSVMTSYNSWDGIPSTVNSRLLNDVLHGEWKFRGFSISDLYGIEGLNGSHRVSSSVAESAAMALKAGLDADLGGEAYSTLINPVKDRSVDEALVDTAVCRILRLKFEMGLFEHPFVEPGKAGREVRSAAHIGLARECARNSIVLLKNNKKILPLSPTGKIAVVGPNADNRYNLLGDYTAPQPESGVITVREGIADKVGMENVIYARGCAVRDTLYNGIKEAVEAARAADVVVAVVGGSSARDFETSYKETGAAVANAAAVSDMDCGEGFDRASLTLLGRQTELLEALKETGTPLIVVYIEGRPLDKNWAHRHADALLTAWYPGQEGGHAIADVLFGDYNPAGRLPVSVPGSAGQLPVYYNRRNPPAHDYVEQASAPLYAFGYGLSYSTFDYSDVKVLAKGDCRFEVSFSLTNSGEYDGDEVPQLYLSDVVASVVQPVKQLKHFRRVHLDKGETKRVCFEMTRDDFSLINASMERVVEPGTFLLQIGSSSDDIRLTLNIEIE